MARAVIMNKMNDVNGINQGNQDFKAALDPNIGVGSGERSAMIFFLAIACLDILPYWQGASLHVRLGTVCVL
ncbi:hypothetical protein NHE_0080 [Neorickettsia helminthoeca str. Oregon]|uniref:Uncharacterized protein n=1 Tax=Neorickettsia helminthoeca str. Oregon TaxID=1286528 RepID=X5H3D2_9RICK|nr:hypothetical protein [Neorickettsia helminthoeca]AHX11051.1 hypothetical protein NHE_0080 [Neorickettsia helminthoeca str. Oregon]